jgi:hypothetical protein
MCFVLDTCNNNTCRHTQPQPAPGRRRALLAALLINALFGLMSSGARSVGALVILRLLGG